MRAKAVYVPLDERHCNYGYPYELGRAADLDIVRPPDSMMSKIKQPSDIEAMWEWVYENIEDADYAILSLDMLVYGSLLNSRHHHLTMEEGRERLGHLRKIKAINSKVEIHAFILIMRVANYDNASEEPDYWGQYGTKIWKYSWLFDKNERDGLSTEEKQRLMDLEKLIPAEYLEDYVNRRKTNLEINLETLNMVADNLIDYLLIPKDDTAEYGFSARDQNIVYQKLSVMKGLQGRVYIYPGADEVGCTLVSRILNKTKGLQPKVYVGYSSTSGPEIVAKYEDRPINESIKWQILSAGGLMLDDYQEADFILMVNTPGKYMKESCEQFQKDHYDMNYRNLEEFVNRLNYFCSIGKICVVADIAYANGAENELVEILIRHKLLEKVAGYGGWNTTSNTLGVVILQGVAAKVLQVKNIIEFPQLFQFHLQKVVKDWAYQSNVLNNVAALLNEQGVNCYNLGGYSEKVRHEIVVRLNEFLKENLSPHLAMGDIAVKSVNLAWNRIFDVEFDLDIQKR